MGRDGFATRCIHIWRRTGRASAKDRKKGKVWAWRCQKCGEQQSAGGVDDGTDQHQDGDTIADGE